MTYLTETVIIVELLVLFLVHVHIVLSFVLCIVPPRHFLELDPNETYCILNDRLVRFLLPRLSWSLADCVATNNCLDSFDQVKTPLEMSALVDTSEVRPRADLLALPNDLKVHLEPQGHIHGSLQ